MTTQHIGTPQRLPIDELTPYHENPRRGDVTAIADSLRAHGQFRPLVVNRGTHTDRPWEVLAGNHTLLAALSLNGSGHEFRTMDCYVVDVSADEARRIVLADNRTSDLGAYDDAALLDMLQGMDDLGGTGYDEDDVAGLLDAMADEDERIEFAAGALADDDDAPDSGPVGAAGGTTGGEGGAAPAMEREAARRTLAARFIIPPFSVIDTRSGRWKTRKRAWHAQGIRSTVGREESLLMGSRLGRWRNWMDIVPIARAAYPGITTEEIEERYADKLVPLASGSDTSEFDPVLAEVLYSWFSAPGHRVLDPWAGGSVRGIVAAALGRDYVGCELRAEQVEANREQWDATRGTIDAPAAAPTLADSTRRTTDPEAITPVQQVGAQWMKREDALTVEGESGSKVRTCLRLARAAREDGAHTLVTGTGRAAPQVTIVAAVAAHLGMEAEVHVPTGATTPETEAAEDMGATIVRHTPGYSTVIAARAREAAEQPGRYLIPFNMETPEAIEYTRAQVVNVPQDAARVVVPVGSGMNLAGILHGLADHSLDVPVLGVIVGSDPTAVLDEYAPEGWRERVELVTSDLPYATDAPEHTLGGVALHPTYEAKCLPYLQPGDLLWIVGASSTMPEADAPPLAIAAPLDLVADDRPTITAAEATPGPAADEAAALYAATSSLPLRAEYAAPLPDTLHHYLALVYDAAEQPLNADTGGPAAPWHPLPDNPDECWVAFTGGKDSVAAALQAEADGMTPVLYHLAGLNRGMADEREHALQVAAARGWRIVIERVSASGKKQGVIELPTKNQVTALYMLNRMAAEGANRWTAGWHTTDAQHERGFGYDYSDGTEAIARFGAYLSERFPGHQYVGRLTTTTEAWAEVAAAGLLRLVKGCVCPPRYKKRVREANVRKWGPLLENRCGSCVKCAWEQQALEALGVSGPRPEYRAHLQQFIDRDFADRAEQHPDLNEWLVPADEATAFRRDDWPDQLDPAEVQTADPEGPLPTGAQVHAGAPAAEGTAEWVTGDSRATMRKMDTADPFDFVIGCPPYYDLEEYSDDPADLSTMSTAEFDEAMIDTLRAADALLAPDSFAAFVVGPVRDKRGHLRDMKMLMIRAAEEIGWGYVNDAVLLNATGTAAIRAARPFVTTRTITRLHQDVVVFVKGDRRAATARCGTVEVAELPTADEPDEE